MRLQSGAAQIDPVALHGHALLHQQSPLALALCEAPVGADDAMPRNVVVDGREDESDEAGRSWIDVPVGADKPSWDGAHPAHDARGSLLGTGGILLFWSGSPGHARAAHDNAYAGKAPSEDRFVVVRFGGRVNWRLCLRRDDRNATRA